MHTLITVRELIKYAELAAALAGLMRLPRMKKAGWQLVPFFLLLLSLLEFIGYYFSEHHMRDENAALYKYIVIPYLFLFAAYFYSKVIVSVRRKLLLPGLVIFIAGWLLEIIFLPYGKLYLLSLTLGILSLFVIIGSLIYYFSLVKTNDLLTFHRSAGFWFCTGMFLFYLFCFPYYSMYNYLALHYRESIFIPYTWVSVCLNFIMYLFFTIGFIWGNRK